MGMSNARTQSPRDVIRCELCGEDFGAITASHLRGRHGYRDDHPIDAYKRRFNVALAKSEATQARINEAVRSWFERTGHRWTRERVIAGIQRRHRPGRPLSSRRVQREDGLLFSAGFRIFGSWEKAVRAAGIDYSRIRLRHGPWSRKEVLAAVCRRARRGLSLAFRDVQRDGNGLVGAGQTRFGTWEAAVRAAGINYADVRHRPFRVDRREVVQELRALARGRRRLVPNDIARRSPRLYAAVYRVFGSWPAAVRTLGPPFDLDRRPWTKRRVLAAIERRRREGRSLKSGDVHRDAPTLMDAVRRLFGVPWRRLLGRLGYRHEGQEVWTRDRILREVQARKKAGKPVNARAVMRADVKLYAAARRRFGSWDAVLQAVGLDPNRVRAIQLWDRKKVSRAIRGLARRGVPLNASYLVHKGYLPIYSAARHWIGKGKWEAIVARALSGAR